MCWGLPGATAMMSLLPANAGGVPTRLARLVHARRVRRGEHVGRRSLLQLRHQVVAAGEVEVDLHAGVGGGEVRAQLREGVRERRSGEDAELARLTGGRVRRRAAGRDREGQRREQRDDDGSGRSGGHDRAGEATEGWSGAWACRRACRRGSRCGRMGRVSMSLAPFQARGGPGVSTRAHDGDHTAPPHGLSVVRPGARSGSRRAKGLEMDAQRVPPAVAAAPACLFTSSRVRYGGGAPPGE